MRLSSTMVDIPGVSYRMPQSFLGRLGDILPADNNATTGYSPGDLATFGTAALSIWDQQQLFQTNLERQARGLPPINISTVGVPTPGVAVSLSPETQSMLMIGGIGLLAVLLFTGRKKS